MRVAVTGAGSGGVFRAAELEAALAADFRVEALANCTIDPAEHDGRSERHAGIPRQSRDGDGAPRHGRIWAP